MESQLQKLAHEVGVAAVAAAKDVLAGVMKTMEDI